MKRERYDAQTQTQNAVLSNNIFNGGQITNNFKINLNIAGVPQNVNNDTNWNEINSEDNL